MSQSAACRRAVRSFQTARDTVTVTVECTATYPDGRRCWGDWHAHVHQPTPCYNGHDERHHAYAPPKSVTLDIAGKRRRVRLT